MTQFALENSIRERFAPQTNVQSLNRYTREGFQSLSIIGIVKIALFCLVIVPAQVFDIVQGNKESSLSGLVLNRTIHHLNTAKDSLAGKVPESIKENWKPLVIAGGILSGIALVVYFRMPNEPVKSNNFFVVAALVAGTAAFGVGKIAKAIFSTPESRLNAAQAHLTKLRSDVTTEEQKVQGLETKKSELDKTIAEKTAALNAALQGVEVEYNKIVTTDLSEWKGKDSSLKQFFGEESYSGLNELYVQLETAQNQATELKKDSGNADLIEASKAARESVIEDLKGIFPFSDSLLKELNVKKTNLESKGESSAVVDSLITLVDAINVAKTANETEITRYAELSLARKQLSENSESINAIQKKVVDLDKEIDTAAEAVDAAQAAVKAAQAAVKAAKTVPLAASARSVTCLSKTKAGTKAALGLGVKGVGLGVQGTKAALGLGVKAAAFVASKSLSAISFFPKKLFGKNKKSA